MKKPTISVAAARGFIDAFVHADADPGAVIESVGLKQAVLQEPDAFVPTATFTRSRASSSVSAAARLPSSSSAWW